MVCDCLREGRCHTSLNYCGPSFLQAELTLTSIKRSPVLAAAEHLAVSYAVCSGRTSRW